MKRFVFLSCAGMALCLLAGCRGSGDAAAIVNGQTISKDQYYKYLQVKPTLRVIVDPSKLQSGQGQIPVQPYDGQVIGSVGLQAMSDLIQRTILMQLAEDQGVKPTPAEVSAEFKDRSQQDPNFARNLTKQGYSTEMIEDSIAVDLAQIKLTTQGINVSDAEVDSYIKDHPNEFVSPALVDLIWILAPNDRVKSDADAALQQGESFINVALKYSAAQNAKQNQARYPVQNVAQLGVPLQGMVEKTDALKQTDWIKTQEGWAKFYVNKKEPARPVPVTDFLKKRVKRALALRQGIQGKDLNQRIQDKLRSSKIEIKIEHLIEPWKESMKTLQPATTAAPTANP